MVYLAEYSDGDLKLIDSSDPANPALLAHATVDGAGISASCLTEDYIVAASGYGDVLFFFARHGHLEGSVTDHNYQPFPGVKLALSNGEGGSQRC